MLVNIRHICQTELEQTTEKLHTCAATQEWSFDRESRGSKKTSSVP